MAGLLQQITKLGKVLINNTERKSTSTYLTIFINGSIIVVASSNKRAPSCSPKVGASMILRRNRTNMITIADYMQSCKIIYINLSVAEVDILRTLKL